VLVAVDPGLGPEAVACVDALAAAFKEPVAVLVAPTDPPDAGLDAALRASPLLVVEGPSLPAWLADLASTRVRAPSPFDAETLLTAAADAAGLTRRAAPKPHGGQVTPLDAERLKAGLADLAARWRLEVVNARNQPFGAKVELAADFRCPSYAEAADFARSVADIADAHDHHPTLVHDWRTVRVRVTTGAAQGRLSERDLTFAAAVDARFSG